MAPSQHGEVTEMCFTAYNKWQHQCEEQDRLGKQHSAAAVQDQYCHKVLRSVWQDQSSPETPGIDIVNITDAMSR